MRRRSAALLAAGLAVACAWGDAAASEPEAVVLVYHRFGDSRHPSTNVTLETFEAQMAILAEGRHTVVPLSKVTAAMRDGTPLPPRAVAITVDDAFASAADNAAPILARYGFPWTLFVATDPVTAGVSDLVDWDGVRALAAAGVAIGAHSAAHAHMAGMTPEARRADLDRMDAAFRREMGAVPRLFAYPFGETDRAFAAVVAARFDAAFGQQSGAIGTGADRSLLPRFPINQAHGDLGRFRTVIDTRPFARVVLDDDRLVVDRLPERLIATFGGGGVPSCFQSGFGAVPLDPQSGDDGFEIRLTPTDRAGRHRLNCTLRTEDGRFRWWGRQWLVR